MSKISVNVDMMIIQMFVQTFMLFAHVLAEHTINKDKQMPTRGGPCMHADH